MTKNDEVLTEFRRFRILDDRMLQYWRVFGLVEKPILWCRQRFWSKQSTATRSKLQTIANRGGEIYPEGFSNTSPSTTGAVASLSNLAKEARLIKPNSSRLCKDSTKPDWTLSKPKIFITLMVRRLIQGNLKDEPGNIEDEVSASSFFTFYCLYSQYWTIPLWSKNLE